MTSRKDQEQYWVRADEPYRFVTVKQFLDAFKSFHVGLKIRDELATPFDKTKGHPAALTTKKYGVRKIELLKACMSREFLLMKRNSFVYLFKLTQVRILIAYTQFSFNLVEILEFNTSSFCTFQLSITALVTMTVFLRTEMRRDSLRDGGIYMGSLFYTLYVIIINGYAETSMTILKFPIFFKQRKLLFYPAWAYAFPTLILKIPITALEVAIWVLPTYYAIGYDPNVGR